MGRKWQMEYSNAAFSHRLKTTRNKSSLSQEELAAKSGVAVESIVLVESGSKTPNLDTAYALAVALGCGIDDLAGLPLPDERG